MLGNHRYLGSASGHAWLCKRNPVPNLKVSNELSEAFVNPEDLKLSKASDVQLNDPDVERVRRAHLNDLESILPYLLIALAYVASGPNATTARILFCLAATGRILHTAVYAFRPVPQPSRAISFFLTFTITIYMAFCVLIKMAKYI
uniref:Microsomal glutathione S-transferase 1 n=1 Tax=Stomoxys calcitrans TaxID=35570 RepID=A0A1I8PY46_STOCA